MSYPAECQQCEETYLTDDPAEVFGRCIDCANTTENTNENNPHNIKLRYGCQRKECLGSVAVFEDGTYGTCPSCGLFQLCEDISAPTTAWEIEHYANMTQPGICDYCENETEVNSEGWCQSCSE